MPRRHILLAVAAIFVLGALFTGVMIEAALGLSLEGSATGLILLAFPGLLFAALCGFYQTRLVYEDPDYLPYMIGTLLCGIFLVQWAMPSALASKATIYTGLMFAFGSFGGRAFARAATSKPRDPAQGS